MGWTVSVSWNAQNDATNIDVSSPPPGQPQPPSSTEERKLIPLDEWRRRVTVEEPKPEQQPARSDEE
jgi:hypothetical protein